MSGDKEYYKKMYTSEDVHLMQSAESARDVKKDRVGELLTFIRENGLKRVGIANCVAVQKEAEQLRKTLEAVGVSVSDCNCKLGKIPSADIVEGSSGVSCNPVGQADFLAKNNTELNISFGLCMGHDILFNKHSSALVTTLVVKDRKYKHNTMAHFSDGGE